VRDQLIVVSTDTWQARPVRDVLVADGPPADWVPAVAWTPDGRAVYWLNRSGWFEVVDVETGRSTRLEGFAFCDDLQWQPLPG
jgi:hypothetical protein